jgi:hypothetical protein
MTTVQKNRPKMEKYGRGSQVLVVLELFDIVSNSKLTPCALKHRHRLRG